MKNSNKSKLSKVYIATFLLLLNMGCFKDALPEVDSSVSPFEVYMYDIFTIVKNRTRVALSLPVG